MNKTLVLKSSRSTDMCSEYSEVM